LGGVFDERVLVYDHDTPDQDQYEGHEGVSRWLADWGAAWGGSKRTSSSTPAKSGWDACRESSREIIPAVGE